MPESSPLPSPSGVVVVVVLLLLPLVMVVVVAAAVVVVMVAAAAVVVVVVAAVVVLIVAVLLVEVLPPSGDGGAAIASPPLHIGIRNASLTLFASSTTCRGVGAEAWVRVGVRVVGAMGWEGKREAREWGYRGGSGGRDGVGGGGVGAGAGRGGEPEMASTRATP